jgi:hypothetical protein
MRAPSIPSLGRCFFCISSIAPILCLYYRIKTDTMGSDKSFSTISNFPNPMLKDLASLGSTVYKIVKLTPLVRATMGDRTRTNCNYSLEAPSLEGCWIYNFDPLRIIANFTRMLPSPSLIWILKH